MVTISNVKVYDLKESVIACRNAMRIYPPEYTDEEFNESLKRAIELAKSPTGSGHNTFLSGIRVSFDITYPNYFSPELQRYHFLDIVTSSSKMHRLNKLNLKSCFNKYIDEHARNEFREYVTTYNYILNEKEGATDKEKYDAFMRMVSNCPMGIELFMRCSTNYLQLKTIYHQRKNHKLKEDWGAFCKFIEELPYAKEFIINN